MVNAGNACHTTALLWLWGKVQSHPVIFQFLASASFSLRHKTVTSQSVDPLCVVIRHTVVKNIPRPNVLFVRRSVVPALQPHQQRRALPLPIALYMLRDVSLLLQLPQHERETASCSCEILQPEIPCAEVLALIIKYHQCCTILELDRQQTIMLPKSWLLVSGPI